MLSSSDLTAISSSELYNPGAGSFIEGPSPVPSEGITTFESSCAVQINQDLTFFANDIAYLYSQSTGLFTDTVTPMLHSADQAACGAATLGNGDRIIVVAGGFENGVRNWVQIYNVNTGFWSEGPGLPSKPERGLIRAGVVQFRDSFLVVGGYDTYDRTDQVLEFDPLRMEWIVLDQTLRIPRSNHFIVDVDKSRFCT